MKNKKASGARYEREVKKIYEDEGFLVTKAGGSLGEFDLICVWPEKTYIESLHMEAFACVPIQVKSTNSVYQKNYLLKHWNSLSGMIWVWLKRGKGRKGGWYKK